ncbi:MAG: DUF5995 family protein [Bacteroidota bacterium]
MPAKSIDDVLDRLDEIIEDNIREEQLFGAFAALYRGVTARVKAGIATSRFEDAARMEKLDVVFANRYLEAYDQYQNGQRPTRSWQLAFDATRSSNLLLIQHLFLGMNAHINLDLGIAAAQIAPGAQIHSLENDFMEINQLLSEMLSETQDKIGQISPLFWLLDWIGGSSDEKLADFSLKVARDNAWRIACRLAPLSTLDLQRQIPAIDDNVFAFGQLIQEPPGFFRSRLFRLVKWLEEKSPRKMIEVLMH